MSGLPLHRCSSTSSMYGTAAVGLVGHAQSKHGHGRSQAGTVAEAAATRRWRASKRLQLTAGALAWSRSIAFRIRCHTSGAGHVALV
jgi:hypothetical protein